MSKDNYFEEKWPWEIREREVLIGNIIRCLNASLTVNNGMDISLIENYRSTVKEHILLVAELIDGRQKEVLGYSPTDMKHYIHSADDIGRGNDELMVANLISFMESPVLINGMPDDEKSLVGSAIRNHILDRAAVVSDKRNPNRLEYQFDGMPDYIYYTNGGSHNGRQTDEAIISNMTSVINPESSVKELFSPEERKALVDLVSAHMSERFSAISKGLKPGLADKFKK